MILLEVATSQVNLNPRRTSRSSLGGRLGLALWVTGLLGACSSPSKAQNNDQQAARNTETYIRIVAGLTLRFKNVTGNYPASLLQLCNHGLTDCGGTRRLDGPNDGWARMLVYNPLDSGFEIRSLGADGRLDTEDDQVFNLSVDRARARKVAGCYDYKSGSFGWSSRVIRLDTAVGNIGPSNATYSLALPSEDSAEWYPVGPDSVVLQWVEHGESVVSVRASADGNTIYAQPDSEHPLAPNIRLVRTPCL